VALFNHLQEFHTWELRSRPGREFEKYTGLGFSGGMPNLILKLCEMVVIIGS
jgi:hypothetical protein